MKKIYTVPGGVREVPLKSLRPTNNWVTHDYYTLYLHPFQSIINRNIT